MNLPETTEDRFLDGWLKILQPAKGFRAAIDSVVLPAAVSAANGRHVLDAGAGVGVAALCLLAREPRLEVSALEADETLAALARENAARNALSLDVQYRDLFAGAGEAKFDQVMTNPPYLDPARAQAPPDAAKARAHVEGAGLEPWIAACFAHLKPGGVLTCIHRADRLGELLAILAARAGDIAVFPLWPRAGAAARRVIVRARLGSKAPARLLAGLVLHGESERYTAQAEAVLRHGGAIDLEP